MTADPVAANLSGPGGPDDRLLSWRKVKDMTGLSRTTAWRRQKAGDFPLAVQITPGRIGWWESELTAWKASRAHRSRSQPPAAPPKPEPRFDAPPAERIPAQAPRAAPETPSGRRGRTRRTAVCEGQIAFEF